MTVIDLTREHRSLLAALQAQREHVLQTLDGLSHEQLTTARLPSGWTPLAVVRHLTVDVERFWFEHVVAGREVDLPPDAEVWLADPGPRAVVEEAYREQARRSDAVIGDRDLGSAPDRWDRVGFPGMGERDLRWVVLHVLTETAVHAGQLDAARELVDGHQHLVLTDL
ncbi:DUF664 domain-containing protein [Klenkia sp. PcliD-1-E]|uniref:mycothiol transferase n=1 Tax=Klenkia sp. PcliD-1-E TaxID=2954492 RepID=UPI002097480D|nr:DUF664 domain-containing protein [Klenkia sp. PcliD-1-E]MCO7220922.1 DinB family protein [Klenkia sp. PcliD-1-E]